MGHRFGSGRRRSTLAAASVAALSLAALAGTTSYAAGNGAPSATAAARSTDQHAARGFYDVRTGSQQAQVAALRTAQRVSARPQARAFQKAAPSDLVTDINGKTGTVRMQSRLSGFLTGPSKAPALAVVRGYVRTHLAALGLAPGDWATFRLARNYRDITGAHHLFLTQRINGQTVLGNGLTATVNRTGHLLTVGGSPITTGAGLHVAATTGSADLPTAADALTAARDATDPDPAATDTTLAEDGVTRGLFVDGATAHPAWQAIVMSAKSPALVVLDAQTGDLLQRQPLVTYEASDSTGRVYPFFPGARRGGKQVPVNFTQRHWLPRNARILKGNNSHTFSDVNDNGRPSASEEVHPLHGRAWAYPLKPFHLPFAKSFCSNPWPCSWNPNKPGSWRTNRAQNATQVFFFVNNWHDHLQKAPIGFTEAAGNFQMVNHGKAGKAGDPVNTQTDDGANTDNGLPDGNHIDNANMSTPPDGRRPTMQMYLQHQPFTSYPDGDPFSPTNVGDEADTVYHEYTHGLSGRLNVDVQGRSTLGGVQAGAMGEAWSDWYAMDYLVDRGLQRDRAAKADVRLFVYDGQGVSFDRTEPIDCKVGQNVRLCNGGETGHRGGYTYADYGKVVGGPEVHSDGEIWAQTLWALRHAIGSTRAEAIVTRAMELAPYNPSFLDMRNAILVADNSVYHGRQRAAIWQVFAKRGMGYFAGSFGGNDSQPGASFATPPRSVNLQSITGTVTDPDNGPVANIPVTLAFQGSGRVNPTTTTAADGTFTLSGIPAGSYPKLRVFGKGYSLSKPVTVGATGGTVSFSVRKDLAATAAGATVAQSSGALFAGCGPAQALDLNQATGWSTNISAGVDPVNTNHFHAKRMVVHLAQPATVTGFGIDPAANCGDGASAATGGVTIETSTDGITFSPATTHTFVPGDNGRINELPAAATGVTDVRLTLTSNQTPDFATNCPNGGYSGCAFVDLSEFQVYGTTP